MEINQLIARYKFDKSIYDNFIPEFNTEFTNYEIVDEYLDTEDIIITSTETMMLMNYDAKPDEYGVLTTEYEVESVSTFNAENIVTRSIYSDRLPTLMKFNKNGNDGTALLEVNCINNTNFTTEEQMFQQCSNLIKVEGFISDIMHNVSHMFNGCNKLTSLDVSNWDTSKVTNMYEAFQNCFNLTSLDVSNWDTSNVTSMHSMFAACYKLNSLDVHNWNVNNVTTMYQMFARCQSLTLLDVSNWDTSNVWNMGSMFWDCQSLTQLDVSSWNTSNVTTMRSMFYNCTNLSSLDLSNWVTNNVTDMGYMFRYCNKLNIVMNNSDYNSVNNIITQLPTRTVESPGTLNVTGVDDISQVNITTAESKYWNVINEESEETKKLVTQYKFNNTLYDNFPIFNDGFSYTYEDVVNEDVTTRTIYSDSLPNAFMFGYDQGATDWTNSLLEINYLDATNVTNMYAVFAFCQNLTYVNINNANIITDTSGMFYNCSSLTTLDLNNFDTSNVTNMKSMFCGCNKLTSLDVSNWDTSNVTNMEKMFYKCSLLTSLDVSNFDTNKVTNMMSMFEHCESLVSLNLSNWDTSNVTNMGNLFDSCYYLTAVVNIENLNTDKVTDMHDMFYDTNISELDLSNWNVDNVTNMEQMFYEIEELKSLNISGWMFNDDVDGTEMFINDYGVCSIEELYMQHSSYGSINKLIELLPVKSENEYAVLYIEGVDDITQVDITTAQTKYWNLVNEVPETNSLRIGDTIINNIYMEDSQVLKICLGDTVIYEASFILGRSKIGTVKLK